MIRGFIAALLALVCIYGVWRFANGFTSGRIAAQTVLGEPAPHNNRKRPPTLAMDLAFTAGGDAILLRRQNGSVEKWAIATETFEVIAIDMKAFAYCGAGDLLALSNAQSARVLNGAEVTASHPAFTYADWSANCATLAMTADAWIKTVGPNNNVSQVYGIPARNGLRLSTDGKTIIAATGTYSDENGHDGYILQILNGKPSPPLREDNAVLGMWRIATGADGRVFVGSQSDGKSGLRAYDADGKALWRQEGFASYWVRGIDQSEQANIVASGDEHGWLRLWRRDTGEKLGEINTGLVIQALAFSPDGDRLAASLWDSTVHVFDVDALLRAR